MNKLEQIDEYAYETDEKMLLLGSDPKDFEDAIIGIAYRFGMEPSVCYDMDKVIEIFTKQFADDIEDGEDPHEMAVEWFEYNVIGAWMGNTTPLYIRVL